MKIEFDKALLWLVPYLYLMSVMYYWGFWSPFNINAFDYYEVSDLVKGVTANIASPISLMAIICSSILIIYFLVRFLSTQAGNLHDKKSKMQYLPLTLLMLIALGFPFLLKIILHRIAGDHARTQVSDYENDISFTQALTVAPAIILFMGYIFRKVAKDSDSIKYNIDNIIVYFLVAYGLIILPSECFSSGRRNALRIKQNKEFDYVIKDSLITPAKQVYKYLGKAGGYCILLANDNVKHVIVPIEKMHPLVVERFSLDDSMSALRFSAHQKEVALAIKSMVSKPQATPQQPMKPK